MPVAMEKCCTYAVHASVYDFPLMVHVPVLSLFLNET